MPYKTVLWNAVQKNEILLVYYAKVAYNELQP